MQVPVIIPVKEIKGRDKRLYAWFDKDHNRSAFFPVTKAFLLKLCREYNLTHASVVRTPLITFIHDLYKQNEIPSPENL